MLFLINLSMDFLTLFIVGSVTRVPIRIPRLIFSSCIGAIYGVASVFLKGNTVIGIAINVAVCLAMCYIAFGRVSAGETALFYATGFLLGGGMSIACRLINRTLYSGYASDPGISVRGIPAGYAALAAALCGAISLLGGRVMRRRGGCEHASVEVEAYGQALRINAFVDSGSMLREPISGLPVMIVPTKLLAKLLPPSLRDIFERGPGALASADARDIVGVRLIAADGIGGRALMLGFIPTRVRIGGEEARLCIAADSTERADPHSAYCGFDAIIPLYALPTASKQHGAHTRKSRADTITARKEGTSK